jgi:hypothetical protein
MTFQSSGRIYRSAIPFGRIDKARPLRLCASQSDRLDHYFVFFALQCLKIFAACANFPVACGYPKRGFCSRQDAKNAKSRSLIFFAAFAPLLEIFRVLDAAQPR